ncbi:hypothetical protein Cni_G18807 [Canna indica]|uniref:Uncharacterized protein n=1 Tax=Canna indica TaxID=4628 RepID=A0AAQ3KJI9_9LILI|nr:hypothetical protein Cni_G18807 [Canna indica]
MCRSTTESIPGTTGYTRERDPLRISAFYLRIFVAGGRWPLLNALTLVYLPRIDGNLLEVNGTRVRAEAPAIVPLHRIRSAEPPRSCGAEAVFASTDRVRAGEGVRFDAYVGEEKVLRGVFRRGNGGWDMELRCAAEREEVGVAAAEAWVQGEKGVSIGRRVEVAAAAQEEGRRRRRRKGFCLRLEEIPEEREGCDCLCCEGGEEEMEEGWEIVGSEGGHSKEWGGKGMNGKDFELEMEGVKWAVDVGIWVMCLGVGLLVSKASSKSLSWKLI